MSTKELLAAWYQEYQRAITSSDFLTWEVRNRLRMMLGRIPVKSLDETSICLTYMRRLNQHSLPPPTETIGHEKSLED